MSNDYEQLRERLAQLADLGHVSALAHWDQQTKMPPLGALARADSLATLQRISHDIFIDDETGRLLEGAAAAINGADPDSDPARLIRLTRRQYDKSRRVPTDLAAELAKAASLGQEAWVAARQASNFAAFAPFLEHNLELARQYVACHRGTGGYDCDYDVLLDDYEPEMKTTTVAALFSELRDELVPLIARVTSEGAAVDDAILHVDVPTDRQRALVDEAVAMMGFAPDAWRLDDTVHPFAVRIGRGDVRITTRWDADYFPGSLYGAMHECGHGLYEAGVDPALSRSPLGSGESLGMHESQSRLWENMVGRGRAFCGVLAPRIHEHFGSSVAGLDGETLFRAVNRVRPTYIRVEADEATYALHIILRFELEQELIEGRLAVADLPEAWNERFARYFGITVDNDADGVLQDVHWSAGLIGYFPTYALGNLIAGQLWEKAHTDLPGLQDAIAAGELGPLREWLVQNIHRHGSKFTTTELLERVIGGPIAVAPFARYLKAKLGAVYGLDFGA